MNGPVLVGQPFTITAFAIPVNVTLTCNCGGDQTTVQITASAPATCASCGHVFFATFDPRTGQVQVGMGVSDAGKAAS